jgi:basic membrane lipoprotein Med (substrate-binding protein (PBP1-ABC) superfamily)
MFSFDQYLGKAELSQLADNWRKLDDPTKTNIAAVFNREHSEAFYRGVAAALYACGKLLTDQNYPAPDKPTVVLGALGYVATKLASSEWPK